jgi:cell pole-organizing protein PopZ
VSASFDDLAKAMIDGNPRQLDAVVEELLRPMLKGWLEDNLPQMVERLVREEIERVSRGRR